MDINTGDLLTKYRARFASLKRSPHKNWGLAPHKPILLLSLLDAIDVGVITGNFVIISPELAVIFHQNWERLVVPNTWQEKMSYPFRHLLTEGFWKLIKDGDLQTADQVGDPGTLMQLARRVDGGQFADDLWTVLCNPSWRNCLRADLLNAYFFGTHTWKLIELPSSLEKEKAKLTEEANAKFRIKHQPDKELGMYIRHALFPRVVTKLYGNACSFCSLDTRTDNGHAIVEAAHIMPFALFHNDDPRNGLALCKNHHWALDVGALSIGDDYSIIVSNRISGKAPIFENNAKIVLPNEITYAPAIEALMWHRQNVFLS